MIKQLTDTQSSRRINTGEIDSDMEEEKGAGDTWYQFLENYQLQYSSTPRLRYLNHLAKYYTWAYLLDEGSSLITLLTSQDMQATSTVTSGCFAVSS